MTDASDRLLEGTIPIVRAMLDAAHAWFQQHPFAQPKFQNLEAKVAHRIGKPEEGLGIIAPLSSALIDDWAENEDARSFLRALDLASNHEATYRMARVVLDLIVEGQIKQRRGQLPEGDWGCTGCGQINDGFTDVNDVRCTPVAGALTVCIDCGALQRINARGNGYEAVTARELNRLPKSFRMKLLRMKAEVEKKSTRQKQRS